MRRFLCLAISLTMLSGCSVFMAATPRTGPDISILKKGTPRATIENELGKPITSLRIGSGDKATYQFISGDEADYGRAAVYAVLTGVTLGMSELVTSPIEALQGERHVVEIQYDRRGRAQSIQHKIHEAPLPNPKRLIGMGAES